MTRKELQRGSLHLCPLYDGVARWALVWNYDYGGGEQNSKRKGGPNLACHLQLQIAGTLALIPSWDLFLKGAMEHVRMSFARSLVARDIHAS